MVPPSLRRPIPVGDPAGDRIALWNRQGFCKTTYGELRDV